MTRFSVATAPQQVGYQDLLRVWAEADDIPEIEGAWLRTDGADMTLNLREKANGKLLRHFSLYGTWQGTELPLQDHKSMFMYIQPGGALTPTRSYTSPVPEKYANVTLSWSTHADFQAICASLAHGSH